MQTLAWENVNKTCLSAVGVDCDEGPPVPIPNTVVKLIHADNTWRAAAREDKSMPTLLFFYYIRPGGQVVKTVASHAAIRSSTLLRVTIFPFQGPLAQLVRATGS